MDQKQITAAVIGIGTELMRGKMDDTNATFLCRWLLERGIRVTVRANVGDTLEDIGAAFKRAAACDLVIATGGLGPTDDDLTREALAAHLGRPLVFDEALWQSIEALFLKRWKTVPESNKRQALTMAGAEALPNRFGTAPGMWCEADGRYFVLLPGPPPENQPMVELALREKLVQSGLLAGELALRVIRCYGIGESALADMLQPIAFATEVGYYFSQAGYVELHFSRFDNGDGAGRAAVEADEKKARALLAAAGVFFTGNEELAKLLLDELVARGHSIAFAESITGGAMAAELVKNPGASQALAGGIVAYSNKMKQTLLDVSPETISDSGAVSEETVREMTFGLRRATGASVCVSVSGIAGPDGGSEAKPVGLTHCGFLIGERYWHKMETFVGGRSRIIARTITFAFGEVLQALAHNDAKGSSGNASGATQKDVRKA
jgi:nicotinamide-nucleotide amidase